MSVRRTIFVEREDAPTYLLLSLVSFGVMAVLFELFAFIGTAGCYVVMLGQKYDILRTYFLELVDPVRWGVGILMAVIFVISSLRHPAGDVETVLKQQ